MKRLFIGTFVSTSELLQEYNKLQKLIGTACSGKWVEYENLHFTWQFLGDVEENQIIELKSTLNDELKFYNSELALQSVGAFPNIKHPNVIFIEIQDKNKIFPEIYKKIINTSSQFGFEPDRRGFTPHLTICRVKSSFAEIKDIISSYKNHNFGYMNDFQINLIESQLERTGPKYYKI